MVGAVENLLRFAEIQSVGSGLAARPEEVVDALASEPVAGDIVAASGTGVPVAAPVPDGGAVGNAVQEGVVAGGGTAPINAIPAVRELCDTLEGDERTGAKIVLKALEAPLRQIAKNAGLEGSVIIDKIVSANKPNYGFDAQNEVFVEDMIAAGIVDPTKVTRSALENAASVAEMVLTTESLVADLPEPPAPAAPAGGDMGGMY